jgi:hypothetical protein
MLIQRMVHYSDFVVILMDWLVEWFGFALMKCLSFLLYLRNERINQILREQSLLVKAISQSC